MTGRQRLRGWLPWLALVVVVAVALVIGSRPAHDETMLDRVHDVAATLKCPQCSDESMATSSVTSAVAGRAEIQRRLEAGQSPDEIRAFFVDSYGTRLLLTPERSGFASIVWILPVVAIVIAIAALAAVFLRWRRVVPVEPSEDDRDAVRRAQRERER
jgi:cytochrome c-type biogenesis protein CcmH